MGQRVNLRSKLKLWSGGGVKASLNRAHFKLTKFGTTKFLKFDPKPSDLVMSRLKK